MLGIWPALQVGRRQQRDGADEVSWHEKGAEADCEWEVGLEGKWVWDRV